MNREPLANAKLKTWWHLINRLGADAAGQMDSVVVPFIRFCYGNPASSSSSSSSPSKPATPAKSAQSPLTPSSPVKKYGSMPPLCLDAVAQLLNCHDKGPNSREGCGNAPFNVLEPVRELKIPYPAGSMRENPLY